MVKIQTKYSLQIGEHPEIEVTEEEAQELCSVLLATLAHTLEPSAVPVSTEEIPPFIPPDARINTEPGP